LAISGFFLYKFKAMHSVIVNFMHAKFPVDDKRNNATFFGVEIYGVDL